jgi:recombination protein RecA
VSQPDNGEQALEIADVLVRSGAVDVVAIDSVAALTPQAELEGQMGDQALGAQARMMSQAMRKLPANLNRTQTLCVLTNQIREKVGVVFGPRETQPGGRALKFYATQRIDLRRIETLKSGTEAIGNRVRAKVVKNKLAPPFRQALRHRVRQRHFKLGLHRRRGFGARHPHEIRVLPHLRRSTSRPRARRRQDIPRGEPRDGKHD